MTKCGNKELAKFGCPYHFIGECSFKILKSDKEACRIKNAIKEEKENKSKCQN